MMKIMANRLFKFTLEENLGTDVSSSFDVIDVDDSLTEDQVKLAALDKFKEWLFYEKGITISFTEVKSETTKPQ